MRASFRILLSALFMSGAAAASAEGPSSASGQADSAGDAPARLDSFVRDAISEGLLTPSRTGTAASVPESPPQIAPLRPKQAVAERVCTGETPYDFAAYRDLKTYDDLLAWRQRAETGGGEESQLGLAGAYIALGLNEEARLQLDGVTGPKATALRRLAYLMEDRSAPDLGYFRALADCPSASALWLSIARLKSDPQAAAEQLGANINAFRRLPLQLRIEVAAMAVPALDAAGERMLAEKIMANFTEAEISGSKRLGFNAALLDMYRRSAAAEREMRGYVRDGEFRKAAVASLLRHGYRVDQDFQSDIADQLVDQIRQGGAPESITGNLDTMLNDLEGVADYSMTFQLAGLPSTQTPETRDRLAEHFMTLVRADLQSTSMMDNLRGMDALTRGSYLIEGREGGESLLADAAARAVDLGFRHLAETFAARTNDTGDLAFARASLAFRTLDHGALKALLEAHPGHAGIVRLAALSAVREGDTALLSRLESRLGTDPDTVLSLIEMDAASGRWVVPGSIYSAAAGLQDEQHRARYHRVRSLRNDTGREATPKRYEISEVGPALKRVRRALAPQTKEMR